jgi:acyl-CoA synthetase (AMP-forming)/AMP-acid ligase II/acyl carrier protein
VISCIHEMIRCQAERNPEAIAIGAPGRRPLSYVGLLNQIRTTCRALRNCGVGRSTRVAIVLPNGPEIATSFLGVVSGATSAPLNPNYTLQEFTYYLKDLKARALIVQAGLDSPARAAAQDCGIPVLELSPSLQAEAGVFTLAPSAPQNPVQDGLAEPDEIALVLHTSGTTSKPKRVPLPQSALTASAHNIRTSLGLSPGDSCLNIMPLFHVHGLVAALLSSLAAGARVTCTPGFLAPGVLDWIEECRPTWYTAVPTMHQAILNRVSAHPDLPLRTSLRFIRSCSSALPPQLMSALESAFDVPVIEAYGMTEAAHQIASNPLPPGRRKPGSVGLMTGPEAAIMDQDGQLLPVGRRGEIVIRGATVTRGYEDNPEANLSAFSAGWFRTGDEGSLDEDGYLHLTGRIKEIINRGGEKISPREVDEVLLDHPAVAQAVAFSIPDPQLGEEIAAAVVLHAGSAASEEQLQEFAAGRLAGFKVPRRVLFVPEIPKGPTGKMQRIGLAEALGVNSPLRPRPERKSAFKPAATQAELLLAGIWGAVLKLDRVSIEDSFIDLGGDSILAAQIIARVRSAVRVELSLRDFFATPTIAGMAQVVESRLANEAANPSTGNAESGMPG